MNRFARSLVIVAAIGLPLAACSSTPDFSGDPTDWFNVDFLNNKKPLPGVRKPVFPDGVPGVTHGVPADLVKGNEPPPNAGLAADQPPPSAATPAQQNASLQTSEGAGAAEQAGAPEEQPAPPPKAKPKPKPKPKRVAAKPAPVVQPEATEHAPTAVTVRRANSPPSSEPPVVQQAPPQEQPSSVQWPAPPPAQGAAPGGVQWPDPPATH